MSGSENYIIFNNDGTVCYMDAFELPVATFKFTQTPGS